MAFTQKTEVLGLPLFQENDIPYWTDLNQAFTSIDLVARSIADKYDASATYEVGDYAWHDAKLYKCATAVTRAEEFDSSKWQTVILADMVKDASVPVDLTGFVKYDANANGITANQYHHLKVN